jgi:tetratricopeptide (TPR) repeat protein
MVSLKSLHLILGSLVGAAFIAASLFFYPAVSIEKKVLIMPPPHLQYFSFGMQPVIADNLWIRAIQDFDYCENQLAKTKCQDNGWVYFMLDAITDLAPDNLAAYSDGGVSLSVIVNDSKGASKIYDKGIKIFKNDFSLLYRAGLHAYYDEKNMTKAADRFLQAARLQGLEGSWLYSLATRLYTDAGKKEVALKLYHQMEEQKLDEIYLKRMREKLGLPEDQ